MRKANVCVISGPCGRDAEGWGGATLSELRDGGVGRAGLWYVALVLDVST